MQHQEASPSVPATSPRSPTASVVVDGAEPMDISVKETSEGVRDLEIDSENAGDDDEEEEEEVGDAEMRGDDEDDSDSDSDYDFDEDLEEFDEEDDNDEEDEDERIDYYESLKQEIEEQTEETERDFYLANMLEQRERLTGEEAEWVDRYIKEQEEWKLKNNGQSVDTYGNIVKLSKFIPQKLERKPKRPVRAARK